MRVAVLYSGQLRGDYKEYTQRMREILPKADFFYTTWDNQKTDALVNRYYNEPMMHYHPNKKTIKDHIAAYRKMKETNWDISFLPPDQRTMKKEQLASLFEQVISGRVATRNQSKQILAHAFAYKDFVKPEHDIVIRIRYDAVVNKSLAIHIKEFCEQVYDNKMPYGFHHYNEDGIAGIVAPTPRIKIRKAYDMNDFMIIHRRDMFDPNYVFYMHEKKKLGIAEAGWWQVLCEPYDIFSMEIKGFVKLHGQKTNDNCQVDNYISDPAGYRYMKYGAKEYMNRVSGNIAGWLETNPRGEWQGGIPPQPDYTKDFKTKKLRS